MFGFFQSQKNTTEKFFQKDRAFALKITTFELLEKLYQASIMTLMPEEMAKEITDTIRKDLEIELAGVYVVEKETDSLLPLAFAKSEKLVSELYRLESLVFEKEKSALEPGVPIKPEALVRDLHELEFFFENTKIANISNNSFFRQIVYGKEDTMITSLREVWGSLIPAPDLEKMEVGSNIKNILGYPLIKGEEVFGVLLLGISRNYTNLGIFERSSMRSIINAIALLIDKAYLYKNLLASYEVEKRGREHMEEAYKVEKKSKQDLEKLDQDKNDFMLITQHHLRTPLTSMAGYIHLIKNESYGKVPKKIMELINKFDSSTKVLIRTVEEFLDISQFQLGQKVIRITSGVDVEAMVGDIAKDLIPQAEAKKLFLKVKKPEQKIPLIEADAMRLATAITSVIDDMIKYTVKGGATVEVAARASTVQIIMQDTGMGMEKAQLDKLFNNLFSRSSEAQKINATGRGVGLYLANKIVQAHQGKIWAESEGKDKGSTFYIELPITQKN